MQLRVKPLKRKDAGSGLASIDRATMEELGVESGEFVAIEGREGRVIARVWPGRTEDRGRGIVRIDGQLRQAAGARIDDAVSVEPADVEPADRVHIALPENVRFQGDVSSYLEDKLSERAVSPGDQLSLSLGFGLLSTRSGRRLPITVVDTEPAGTVVVGSQTDIRVVDRSRDELSIEAEGPLSAEEAPAAETPDVTYEDVGGLEDAKGRLRETIQWPIEHGDAYERVALSPTKGVLLYGPPGTGKTLLAKAVANESQSNFISVKGPELFDKFVGESERAVRDVFDKARTNAPTIVFFDEIDALASERGRGIGDSNVGERVVSQLLTELDGLEELEDVVVVAASNRPELIDDALLRPGRLDRHVEVGDPDEEARREIVEIHTRDRPLADDVDLAEFAAETDGFTGADIEAVCREAATIAVREHVRAEAAGEESDIESIELTTEHFEQAIEEVSPEAAEEFTGETGGFEDVIEGAEGEA